MKIYFSTTHRNFYKQIEKKKILVVLKGRFHVPDIMSEIYPTIKYHIIYVISESEKNFLVQKIIIIVIWIIREKILYFFFISKIINICAIRELFPKISYCSLHSCADTNCLLVYTVYMWSMYYKLFS